MNDFFDELNNFSNLLEINEKEEEKIKEKKYTNTTSYEDKQLKKEINEFTKITKIYRDCEKSHKKINKIIKEMNSKILIVYGYNILMEENLKTMLNYVNMSILKKTEIKKKEIGINMNSNIIGELSEYNLINDKLEDIYKKKIRYELLYRASNDGGFGKIFKKKCSRTRGTLILVQSKSNKKFGGFTEAVWNDSNNGYKDENTFCFSLDKNKIYIAKKYGSSIYCKENAGPIFCDMFGINSNFAYEGGYSTNLEISLTKYENVEENFELSGEEYFKIKELEVFKIRPIIE